MTDALAFGIDQIIDIARGAEPAGEFERVNRDTRRLPYDGGIALLPLSTEGDPDSPLPVRGKDISATGLGVIAPRELAVGQRAAVMILRSNGDPVLLGVRVVHCHDAGPNQHETGLEFTNLPKGVILHDFRGQDGGMPQLAPDRAA